MGTRKRKHKQAIIAGTEKPFRASPDKPKGSDSQVTLDVVQKELTDTTEKLNVALKKIGRSIK